MSKKNKLPKSFNTLNDKDDGNGSSDLPGWPGYRTRDGRSGYDPIDTRTEAAHTAGTFIQKLFAGQLRIKNPVLLVLTGILGMALSAPFFLAVFETINGNLPSWDAWFTMLIAAIVGLALLINFIKNLIKT
jgi:hypothetical protein